MDELRGRGIIIKSPVDAGRRRSGAGAYKDSTAVVEATHLAGLSRKVAPLDPISASRVKTDHGKMMPVTDRIAIDEDEIEEVFVRAGGPGGQNVNKVATAVQLRFDAFRSPSLDEATRARLRLFAGRRMTADGVLVIMARRFRTQERNRQDAYERLIDLIGRAAQPRKSRIPTRPTAASRGRRREAKLARGRTKRLRQPVEQQVE